MNAWKNGENLNSQCVIVCEGEGPINPVLFYLDNVSSEQHDVSAQYPKVVNPCHAISSESLQTFLFSGPMYKDFQGL